MKAQGKFFVYAMPERTHDATVLIAFKTKTDRAMAKKLLPGFREEDVNVLRYDFFNANASDVALVLDRFIAGDEKSAKLIPSQPLVFQGPIFDLDFSVALRKEPSPKHAGMTNRERFADEYGKALVKCIQKNPTDYMYGVDRVPEMVVKFLPSLAKGEAILGQASKSAARACGIKPTLGAIKSFLNS
jgi:hypothetical protein